MTAEEYTKQQQEKAAAESSPETESSAEIEETEAAETATN